MCLITIITVVYNDKQNIARTMKSVLNQTYQDLEYILIDGNSSDGTMDEINSVIREFPNRSIRLISEPDKGVYDAMNKGIANSSGDWLNFMNSGDVFHSSNVLEEMQFDKEKNPHVIYYANSMVSHWDGTYLEKPSPFFKTPHKFKGIGINHNTMFFPGEIVRNMKHNLDYKICADYDFCMRLYKAGYQFVYRDVIVVDYSWGNGISSNPLGQIPIRKENAKIAEQTLNTFYWAYLLREYYRLWQRRRLLKKK